MTNNGRQWESEITNYLKDKLLGVVRPFQMGFQDKGDIIASPFVIQAKDTKGHDLSGALDAVQKQLAGERFGVAAFRRRGKGVQDGYVVMNMKTFREVAWRIKTAEEALFYGSSYDLYLQAWEESFNAD